MNKSPSKFFIFPQFSGIIPLMRLFAFLLFSTLLTFSVQPDVDASKIRILKEIPRGKFYQNQYQYRPRIHFPIPPRQRWQDRPQIHFPDLSRDDLLRHKDLLEWGWEGGKSYYEWKKEQEAKQKWRRRNEDGRVSPYFRERNWKPFDQRKLDDEWRKIKPRNPDIEYWRKFPRNSLDFPDLEKNRLIKID